MSVSAAAPAILDPTAEQTAIIDAARRGESFRVLAFAGTGKTTTLLMVARALPADRPVVYVVFNAAARADAERRFTGLRQVQIRTAHSLAYAAMSDRFGARIERGNTVLANTWMEFLEERGALVGDQEPATTARAIFTAITRFSQSGDDRVDVAHVPADTPERERISALARRFWASLMSEPKLPVNDDIYLKAWQLTRPTLNVGTILFDEAQDASAAMLEIVRHQPAQQIYVGDEHQAIYEWRGAVNALASIDLTAYPLTESWRFGPAIAEVANAILRAKGEKHQLRGCGPEDSAAYSGSSRAIPDLILARSNVGLVETALGVIERGGKPFTRGATKRGGIAADGGGELRALIGAAYDLYKGRRSNHTAFELFQTWRDLRKAAEADGGERFRPYVRLVDDYGDEIPRMLARLKQHSAVSEQAADVVLSTVHRFKGEQRPNVQLARDFHEFVRESKDEPNKPTPSRMVFVEEEANTAYVAVTRAQQTLWLAGAEQAIVRSLERVGVDLRIPVEPSTRATTATTVAAASGAGSGESGGAASAPADAGITVEQLVPGSAWIAPAFGRITIVSADKHTITATLSSGERKVLATLYVMHRLKRP